MSDILSFDFYVVDKHSKGKCKLHSAILKHDQPSKRKPEYRGFFMVSLVSALIRVLFLFC